MSSSSVATAPLSGTDDGPLGWDVWRVAIAMILGTFMSIIDMTIVNVALQDLGTDLNATGFDQVQWVVTAYMLSVAAVIPVTGWLSERIGGKRLFVASIALFTIASALCAVSWNLWSLVGFRVLQGIAGGMLMPAGQILLARAAGAHRMGRVMSIIGVPILLAPVLGPVLGGLILTSLPWEWIFIVNVPVGIVGTIVALRLLPRDRTDDAHRSTRKLDVAGLVLLSSGLPLVVFGLANIAGHGLHAFRAWAPIVGGVLLVAAFVVHARRATDPLLNVRLFASRAYAMASITTVAAGGVLFGSIILMPLYLQVARGEDVLTAGLLMAPQGLGAALGIAVTGRLSDRIGGGLVTIMGLVILTVGTIPFTQLGGDTSYVFLSAAMVVRGFGFGSTMMPAMAAAYATLDQRDIAHATPQLNVLQRVGGAVGTAILATILQSHLAELGGGAAGTRIGEGSASRLDRLSPAALDAVAGAFGSTFWWVIGGSALALIPAIFLARAEQAARADKRLAAESAGDRDERAADAIAAATTGEPVGVPE